MGKIEPSLSAIPPEAHGRSHNFQIILRNGARVGLSGPLVGMFSGDGHRKRAFPGTMAEIQPPGAGPGDAPGNLPGLQICISSGNYPNCPAPGNFPGSGCAAKKAGAVGRFPPFCLTINEVYIHMVSSPYYLLPLYFRSCLATISVRWIISTLS